MGVRREKEEEEGSEVEVRDLSPLRENTQGNPE